MSKRINIVLPEITIQAIDRLAKAGERSRFINHAVQYFIAHQSAEALRTQLERTALRDQDLDREIAADWSSTDQETWQQLDEPKRKPVTRGGVKSTSRRSIRH
jgi:CopG family transcriptional regulator / antitoxin EndoAI